MVPEESPADGVDPDALRPPATGVEPIDSGPTDAELTDPDPAYAGPVDAGPVDTGPVDTGPADDWPTWPKPAPFSPTPAFQDPHRIKPSRHQPASAQIPPSIPMDPILPYIAPPVPRRRRSDWPVLLVAMIISALVMAGCCIAGFALYSGYGGPLFN